MDWIYFVVLATLMWNFSNIADKFLIDKRINKPIVMTIIIRINREDNPRHLRAVDGI